MVDNICGDLDFEDGGNPVEMNRVLAAVDPVLMDAYVCDMMYYQVEEVPTSQRLPPLVLAAPTSARQKSTPSTATPALPFLNPEKW